MWFAKRRKKVVIVDQSANGIKDANSLNGPLNGRLTCIKSVTQELQRTFDVTVLGKHEGFYDDAGVLWDSRAIEDNYDALVLVRGYGSGLPEIDAKKRFLWVRDLPHSGFCPEPELLKYATVVALSEYGAKIWKAFHPQIDRIKIIPNGVDDKVFRLSGGGRERKLLLYASAPNRGLDRLPSIFETLKELHPSLRLVAFSNLKKLHPGESGEYEDVYQKCLDAGIELRDPVSHKELAKWMQAATAMVMPTDFPEICSNTVLQALACGLPIVTTGKLGATPEWVKDGENGVLTRFQRHDYQIFDLEIIRACHKLLSDDMFFSGIERGARYTPVPSWKEVAGRWASLLS